MIRLVLIEDDDLMREWLGRSLASRGYEVTRYRRADEALSPVSANPPDVIVSDVRMPGISGLEFGHRLRARGIGVPMVFMTADPSEAAEVEARAIGARRMLRKPFGDLSELWMAIDAALASAHACPDEDHTRASHALRTPLTAVRIALEGLVASRELDERESRLADIASRNLERLATAVEDHLSRLALLSERETTADVD